MQTMQWKVWQVHPWVMVVMWRVALRACAEMRGENSRTRTGNRHVVNHVVTLRGAWILGVWHLGSRHMRMPCAVSALFGPPTPPFRGTGVMRPPLLDQAADHPGMPLSAGVAAVSISLPYLRKVAICQKMSAPLDRAGHLRPLATRRLAGHVIRYSIGSNGWFVIVHEKADFSLDMPDGIPVTLS